MKNSTASPTRRSNILCAVAGGLLLAVAVCSLFVGKYPLSLKLLLQGDETQLKVFFNLRLTRTAVAIVGGCALAVAGYAFQTVFSNPLASPDIIGVSSGASAGAAVGILFLSGTVAVTVSAFVGAILAVLLTLLLAGHSRNTQSGTIVLAGIAVHSLAQTLLMALKLTADPERELASIEYWIMGSLNGISAASASFNLPLAAICIIFLFLMHRQLLLLSTDRHEAKMLGVPVEWMRLLTLLVSTLCVAATVSIAGIVSFVGLIAPHLARMLAQGNRLSTMTLTGLLGAIILCFADILARSVAATELPISIFTSLLGAPFLIALVFREKKL